MTDNERREAARQFYQKWVNRGREDEDDRSYWIDFLQNVMGIDHVTDRIEFQKKVVGPDGNTKRIDAYIPETRVLIEQKTLGIGLDKPQQGHGGMTPYEQAKMYDNSLPVSEKAKWIILSNFAEIWVYDMDTRVPEPKKFTLDEIPTKYSAFDFIVDARQQEIVKEEAVSVEAGNFVSALYDAFSSQYIDISKLKSQQDLNKLCVRIVFCLYAEDAHIFGNTGHEFYDYLNQFETKDLRKALIELFKILNVKETEREVDPYDTSGLYDFPYVNGGLFKEDNIEIPQFTDEIRNVLLSKGSREFDWSAISPTVFGAVFESTIATKQRRENGMHYTSIVDIHKLIDPLFLDDLKEEYQKIGEITTAKTRKVKLESLQNKLAGIKWMDPACGSGNFLTETYLSIRRLENLIIRDILDCDRKQVAGQMVFGEAINPIKVSINQFYGIEINDFAVTVAKTALWIAESQMMKETEDIILAHLEFLPLETNANIIEQNALRMDWNDFISNKELDYIMGNPPFSGARFMGDSQKNDLAYVFGDKWKNVGNLDYVAGWYKKASDYMTGTYIRAALVSTNSATQGEMVPNLWKPLFSDGIHIDYAHRTFEWKNEAKDTAKVHCVIVGFSKANNEKPKQIFTDNEPRIATNINAYLLDMDNVFVESRKHPICDVPEIGVGNKPVDGGFYLFTEDEKNEFLLKEPNAREYFHPWYGAKEFINRCPRYCLYLGDCEPSALRRMPEALKRVNSVKEFRESSTSPGTRKIAQTPTKFHVTNMPKGTFLVIPQVSSQRRRYIPIGYMDDGVLCSDKVRIMPDASLYHFGILTSNIHMAWMRAICCRLKSDYSYTVDDVYNNFPWPDATEDQKMKIAETAQGILDARALFPNSSLADLYDPLTMPRELQKAHSLNDKAVMQAYGLPIKETTEEDCVAFLMKLYDELTR